MQVEDCLEMLRMIKDVAFATVDRNGLPQVRFIDIMLVEKQTIYFCTARGKAFYQQLQNNPHVAITGMNQDYQMIRIQGVAKKVAKQKEWIDRIFDHNPSMEDVYPNQSRYILEAFCMENGEIEFFDLGKVPIVRNYFTFGNCKANEHGFYIKETCIGCGKCIRICPQSCIHSGKPFSIQQTHCLHCGLCQEMCPVGAIERRGNVT